MVRLNTQDPKQIQLAKNIQIARTIVDNQLTSWIAIEINKNNQAYQLLNSLVGMTQVSPDEIFRDTLKCFLAYLIRLFEQIQQQNKNDERDLFQIEKLEVDEQKSNSYYLALNAQISTKIRPGNHDNSFTFNREPIQGQYVVTIGYTLTKKLEIKATPDLHNQYENKIIDRYFNEFAHC